MKVLRMTHLSLLFTLRHQNTDHVYVVFFFRSFVQLGLAREQFLATANLPESYHKIEEIGREGNLPICTDVLCVTNLNSADVANHFGLMKNTHSISCMY